MRAGLGRNVGRLPLTFEEFKVQPADYQLVRVIEDLFGFGLVRSEDREEVH